MYDVVVVLVVPDVPTSVVVCRPTGIALARMKLLASLPLWTQPLKVTVFASPFSESIFVVVVVLLSCACRAAAQAIAIVTLTIVLLLCILLEVQHAAGLLAGGCINEAIAGVELDRRKSI